MSDKYFPIPSDKWAMPQLLVPFNFGFRAQVAYDLLRTNCSLILARPDGEDSAGRAKLRPADPEELVNFVFAIADHFVAQAEARGEVQLNILPPKSDTPKSDPMPDPR